MQSKPQILLVEDNQGDITLFKTAIIGVGKEYEIEIAKDGERAMQILMGVSAGGDHFRPNLIFLDLNLPKVDGFQVLKLIRERDELKHLPVVVFSSSDAQADIVKAYELNANAYVIKPIQFNDYSLRIAETLEYWLNIVMLPERNA